MDAAAPQAQPAIFERSNTIKCLLNTMCFHKKVVHLVSLLLFITEHLISLVTS
jgi:hypothetical protein